MTTYSRWDIHARSELLTFLVISHLFTKHITGRWMTPANTVESAKSWARKNSRDGDLLSRVRLACWAQNVAECIGSEAGVALNASFFASMFDSRLRLDFAAPTTRSIYRTCQRHLLSISTMN